MITKINKNKKIIILTFSILLFLLILLDVYKYEVTSYDNWAYLTFVENGRSDMMTNIMKFITSFGSALFLITGLFLILLFAEEKKYFLYGSINLLLVTIINNAVKIIVRRPRPSGYNLIVESNFSFPSGHSMASTAFYGFLIYLVYKKIKDKRLKYFLISVLFILIVSICISRIYLGVHYLSDTLAGFFFSLAYLMVFVTVISKYELKRGKMYEKKKIKD